jgi:hypothetical protein
MCNEEKALSYGNFSTDGQGFRKECRPCQGKGNIISDHAARGRKLGLHTKLEGEGMEEFRDIIMNLECVLTGSSENLTLDHIVPVALTGGTHIGNYLPIRRELNASKGKLPFFLWIRTNCFQKIAERFNVTQTGIDRYTLLAALLNHMSADQYERYTLWVWKMQQDEATKHITANPTFSEASDNGIGELHGFYHDGTAYYRPTVTAEERNEIYAKWDAEQMAK